MKKNLRCFLLAIGTLLLTKAETFAQCAMCNATAESSLDAGSTAAKGLNVGVLYLFAMPALFGAVFVFLYFRNKKNIES